MNEIKLGFYIGRASPFESILSKKINKTEYKHLVKNINNLRKFELILMPYLSWIFALRKYEEFKNRLYNSINNIENIHFDNSSRFLAESSFEISTFLFAFRQLIDIYSKLLKNNFPDLLFGTFETHTKYLYDNYFSYRFCYKLRNYVQHRNLPLLTRIYTWKPNQTLIKNETIIALDRDKLLSEDNWGNFLLELKNQKRNIEILPLLNELNLHCSSLYGIVLNYCRHKNWKSLNIINQILLDIENNEGTANLIYIGKKKDSIRSKMISIPENFVQILISNNIKD